MTLEPLEAVDHGLLLLSALKKRALKHDSSRLEAFFACLHIFNFLYGLFMVPVTNVVNLSLRA
jgi:hypothetical protein